MSTLMSLISEEENRDEINTIFSFRDLYFNERFIFAQISRLFFFTIVYKYLSGHASCGIITMTFLANQEVFNSLAVFSSSTDTAWPVVWLFDYSEVLGFHQRSFKKYHLFYCHVSSGRKRTCYSCFPLPSPVSNLKFSISQTGFHSRLKSRVYHFIQ